MRQHAWFQEIPIGCTFKIVGNERKLLVKLNNNIECNTGDSPLDPSPPERTYTTLMHTPVIPQAEPCDETEKGATA